MSSFKNKIKQKNMCLCLYVPKDKNSCYEQSPIVLSFWESEEWIYFSEELKTTFKKENKKPLLAYHFQRT